MKRKSSLSLVGLCGVCAAVLIQEASAASSPSLSPTPKEAHAQTSDSTDGSSQVLTRAEALKLVAEARKYVAHPQKEPNQVIAEPKVTTPDFQMAEAPPAPRPETKPEAPGTGYVWVPGHYMPVKGQWRWVRGEWAVPALPISVWIPARYDEKEKKWSPGYWQPDVPATSAPETTTKEGKAMPVPSGY